MKRLIYADNAATTKMSQAACEAMVRFQLENFANASQPYSFARNAKKALKESRQIIAGCIGANPDEIYFTSCGTESDNWVIKGVNCSTIITSPIEHHAILKPCAEVEKQGRKILYIPVNATGIVDTIALKQMVKQDSLVSVMMANNEIGTVQSINELAFIAHENGSLFHTDAVQAVGHIHINVEELGIDLLSASAHKFNGPKGIGFLYIKDGVKLNPLISGGAQELSNRAGTENVAAIVAMAIALQENIDNIDINSQWLLSLEQELLELLDNSGVSYVRNGDVRHIPGCISLSFAGFSGESILHRLDFQGICISTGSACDSKDTKISHVLKAIGLEESLAKGTIRISLGHTNTIEDVRIIAEALIKIVK